MNKILDILAHNKSAFRHMAICAVVIGIGDVLCAVTDLYWLIGDMQVQIHPHHWVVLAGLITANICIGISFIWLAKSLWAYAIKHDAKVFDKKLTKKRVAKQSEVIMHLNQRISDLENRLGDL